VVSKNPDMLIRLERRKIDHSIATSRFFDCVLKRDYVENAAEMGGFRGESQTDVT